MTSERGNNVYCEFCGHIGKVYADDKHPIAWWVDKLKREHADEMHS